MSKRFYCNGKKGLCPPNMRCFSLEEGDIRRCEFYDGTGGREIEIAGHKPPLLCRIRAKLIPPSPSVMLCKCALGLRNKTRKCPGCEANTGETICEAILAGFASGLGEFKEGAEK